MQAERTSIETASIATPHQAMRVLEARRAWWTVLAIGTMSGVAAVLVVVIGGDPLAQKIHASALAVNTAVMGLYALARRDPAKYRPNEVVGVVGVAIVADMTGLFYWGVYSAFLGIVTLAAFAIAPTVRRAPLIVFSVLVTVSIAALGTAQLAGWVGEHGLVGVTAVATHGAQVVALVLICVLVVLAILLGVQSRTHMQRILDEHHAAVRELLQREAQLAEAHQEVRAARAPGQGRFTGQTVGRFKLGRLLGRGAMGEVYDATDETGAPCAVKLLAANLLDNDDAQRRFQREARAIQDLSEQGTPNIVKMIEVSPPTAAQPYFAMERLEGKDLAELIKERPVRPVSDVVEIVDAVAAGLDAAHGAGIVHRDLKPANLFASRSEGGTTWKILDFGVSKLFDGDSTVSAGHLVGTPGYMAPEQARSEPVDHRADIYALGVVVYRLLTGRPAVLPADTPAMVHDVVYRVPPQPSQLADVSPAVEAVLAIALAKHPSERFTSAGELAHALADAAAGRLPRSIYVRAEKILARAPWGHSPRARTRMETLRDQ